MNNQLLTTAALLNRPQKELARHLCSFSKKYYTFSQDNLHTARQTQNQFDIF